MSALPGETVRPPGSASHLTEARGFARYSDGVLFIALALGAILPYANILLNDFAFVYDDGAQVLNNPYVHSFRFLREIFTSTVRAGGYASTNYYRPVTTLGNLLAYQLFGPSAYGFHLISLLLHTLVACVLFGLGCKLFAERARAFLAAALFALHPIHTEAVAWVAAVPELWLAVFYLLTFLFFLEVARPTPGLALWPWLAMAGTYSLALLSKEQALTLPWLAAIYEHFYRADRAQTTGREKVARYGVLWLLAIAYLLFRIKVLGAFAPTLQRPDLGWYSALLSAVSLVAQYVGKLLWPVKLWAYYVFQSSEHLLDFRVLCGLLSLFVLAILFVYLFRRARMASFGLLWLVITLAPVLNARWMGANVFAERYLYLPSVGFCWLAACGAMALWRHVSRRNLVWRRALLAAACLATILSAVRIFSRNLDWRNDVTLLERTLADSTGDYRLRNGLAVAYWMRGDKEAAEREWRKVLAQAPNNVSTLNYLGRVYASQRRYAQALPFFQRATQLEPEYAAAHLNLGAAYAEMGMWQEAEAQLRTAVALDSLNFQARNILGKLYFDSGDLRAAEEQFTRSAECEPNVAAYVHLGYIYTRRGDYGCAEKVLRAALALNPAESQAHLKLGLIYAATERGSQAEEELRRALEADPRNPEALSALQQLRRRRVKPERP